MSRRYDKPPSGGERHVTWIEEWQGSGPQRGYHIREATHLHNNRVVAYLGDQVSGAEVDKLIAEHNGKHPNGDPIRPEPERGQIPSAKAWCDENAVATTGEWQAGWDACRVEFPRAAPPSGGECKEVLREVMEWARPMEDAPESARPQWFGKAKSALGDRYEWLDAKIGTWKPIDRLPYTWERELGIQWRERTAPPSAPVGVEAFEDALTEYVEDYEFHGEDESGRDGCYTPNERERLLIEDAIRGWEAEKPLALAQQPADPITAYYTDRNRAGWAAPRRATAADTPPSAPVGVEGFDVWWMRTNGTPITGSVAEEESDCG